MDLNNGENKSINWVVSATLTVLLTIGVGLAALLAAQADADSADNYALSALSLNDANLFFSQGIESVLEQIATDYDYWPDRDCLNQVLTAEISDKCSSVSDQYTELVESNTTIQLATEFQDQADEAWDKGLRESSDSVKYQVVVLFFAIGLSLVALASIGNSRIRSHYLLLFLSALALAFGIVRLIII
tara:strand:+ start:962 stop:1525 length:564 start_codon:yes stop_codon:yes gene_type:complete